MCSINIVSVTNTVQNSSNGIRLYSCWFIRSLSLRVKHDSLADLSECDECRIRCIGTAISNNGRQLGARTPLDIGLLLYLQISKCIRCTHNVFISTINVYFHESHTPAMRMDTRVLTAGEAQAMIQLQWNWSFCCVQLIGNCCLFICLQVWRIV